MNHSTLSMSSSHHEPKSDNLFSFTIILSVAIALLGAIGFIHSFKEADGHWSILEVAEKTLGLFESESVIFVKGQEVEAYWTIGLAKVLAKVLVLTLAATSLLALFKGRYQIWRFRNASNHSVYIGIGDRGKFLAHDATKTGLVAAIDLDEHNPARALLTRQNALFLVGNGSDSSLLHNVRTPHAARVVILTRSDDVNAHIAERVVEEWQRAHKEGSTKTAPELLVSIASPEFRELLRERWDLVCNRKAGQPSVKLIGFQSVALRSVLQDMATKAGVSKEVRKRGMNILVAGDDAFVEEFMKLAVTFLQISGPQRPRFVVCTSERDLSGEFSRRYPAIHLVADVQFVEDDPVDVAWAPGLDGALFDFAVVALETEAQSLFVAERVLRSSRFETVRVLALVQGLPAIKVTPLEKMRVVSMFESGCKSAEFGDLSLESRAQAFHEAYLAGLGPQERASDMQWDNLPENLKESNRWAVLHSEVKKNIWNAASESEHSELLEHLAQSEHNRWMGEKVMDGWQSGEKRDNIHRIHPDIRLYTELTEEGREKDRVQVRKALGMR